MSLRQKDLFLMSFNISTNVSALSLGGSGQAIL